MKNKIASFKTIKTKQVYHNHYLTINEDIIVKSSSRAKNTKKIQSKFYSFDFTDWITVCAIDKNKKIVLIKQWRHGIKKFTLEVPGGTMDKGEKSSIKAAKRELQEETGYTSKNWKSLGWCYPNPAVQKNKMHFFLALDAEQTNETAFDEDEDIETILVTKEECLKLIKDGKITHSLALLCLARGLH